MLSEAVSQKLLVYGASIGGDLEDAAGFGWSVDKAVHDWPALIAAKNRELDRWKAFTEICLHLLARNWLQGAVKSWVRIRSA